MLHYLPCRECISSDVWVLKIVKWGYKFEFNFLCQLSLSILAHYNVLPELDLPLQDLVRKGGVEEVSGDLNSPVFYSKFFLMDKKDGGNVLTYI